MLDQKSLPNKRSLFRNNRQHTRKKVCEKLKISSNNSAIREESILCSVINNLTKEPTFNHNAIVLDHNK